MRYIHAGCIMRGWTADDDAAFNDAVAKLYGDDRFVRFSHTQIAWIIYDDLPTGRDYGVHVLVRDTSPATLIDRQQHPNGRRPLPSLRRARPFAILDRRAEDWASLADCVGRLHAGGHFRTVPVDCLRQAVIDDWADAVYGWDVGRIARKLSVATLHWRLMFPFGPPRPDHFTGMS